MIAFVQDDGGRAAAGYRGETGDCAVRAVAIAAELPYSDVYDRVNALAKGARRGSRIAESNARTGVHRELMHKLMADLGFEWTATMQIGSGCKVHVRAGELPAGRLVLNLSKHYAAFIDGALHDTYDCSREGTRCVYGYWRKATA